MRAAFPAATARLVAGLVVGALTVVMLPSSSQAAATAARMTRWSTDADFATGTSARLAVSGGSLRLGSSAREYGSWKSPWTGPGFDVSALVPSWNVETPTETWARIDLRVRRGSTIGSWDNLATWSSDTSTIRRSSFTSQTDDLAEVDVDTLRSRGGAFDHWQIRVVLLRKAGSTATPVLKSVGAVESAYVTKQLSSTSTTTMTATKVLNVPTYSQMIHRDEYPQYAGGGEAWCSPTTAIMLLRFWQKGPSSADYAFAAQHADPWVDHAAINSYDYRYERTGNWSFTMAYAGRYADAYVTRVGSLRNAERLIQAGIPVGAAISFGSGELSGAPLRSTPGHLVAVVGFTSSGDVVVNDPAATSDSTVRRTYKRAEFERAWLGGSGGIAYVVRP